MNNEVKIDRYMNKSN